MDNNKTFLWFVKSQQKYNIGIAPLQNDEGKQAEDTKVKAEILNNFNQFSHTLMIMKYLKWMDRITFK